MKETKLYCALPEDIAVTPDGMAIDHEGNLILSCPNYADPSKQGVILRIDKERHIMKWADVPVHEETGKSHPMGIAFGPDGDLYICDNQGWSGDPSLVFKGRILRLRVRDGLVERCTVVATGMEHPNGIRIKDGYAYVTQSLLSKVQDSSKLLVSCVYRFKLDEENIEITNTLEDRHILTTFITQNVDCQYGADGIAFDKEGRMYVGNFGDGAVHRICFDESGEVTSNEVWAQNSAELQSTDGMIFDDNGNLYIADFSANAIAKVTPDGVVKRIAQSPDTDGLNGELDQPGEPIVYGGKVIASCFDLVTGPDKVNTGHELPATLCYFDLD
ncbi:SMP-30/gluconolactonase/LRE family protein [Paenibacillus paeoniae]|uniref:Phage head-tail adapter protein n=1 Tax=Paenibacillus paeoniae TaxID=2292705 RepID=A0A371P5H7_9BACL|nr:SMP-30/gluconolactonase/LRE family protein [Paenibacillus paeoniae]REK71204.1 phage head-tail adapter protein [Paenibacillus paeoniae]